jgi:hypothetical protein
VAAVAATLVGLPAVLVAGTWLRHTRHVSPAATNVVELRLRLLGHGIACDHPVPEPDTVPERPHGAAGVLRCDGPAGFRLRLATYANPTAAAADGPRPGPAAFGANWRVEVVLPPNAPRPAAESLTDRIAAALTGRVSDVVARADA